MESPEDGTGFIQSRFGLETGKPHSSAAKSQIKKKDGAAAPKGKRAPRGEKAPASAPAPRAAPAAQPAATGPDMIGDLEAVKSLVKKLGAEQVGRIVGPFEDQEHSGSQRLRADDGESTDRPGSLNRPRVARVLADKPLVNLVREGGEKIRQSRFRA